MKIKNVIIVTKPNPSSILINFLKNLETWLLNRKINIFCVRTSKNILLKKTTFIEDVNQIKDVQLIISLGGDGTLIGICRKLKNRKIPIVGVNLGGLGFIANFTKNDIFEHIENIINMKYSMTYVPIFSAIHKTQNLNSKSYSFINDIVISKNEISRIFPIELEVDNNHVYNLSGDGLIVSSPIGSTAYSLAAGGPIIHPGVKSMVITPICPHSLTHRPLVIPDSSEIKLKISNHSKNLILTLDGQETIYLDKRDSIIIKISNRKKCLLIENPEMNCYLKLKEKFILGRK